MKNSPVRFRLRTALLLGLLATPLFSQDGTGWRTKRLDLELSILPDERLLIVEGVAQLELEAESSRGPAMQMKDLVDGDFWIEAKCREGKPVSVAHTRGIGRILRFPESFARGDQLTVHFAYESRAQLDQLVTAPEIAFGSWVEYWYPTPVPSDSTDARTRHAPGTTTFHLPVGWRGVTNGELVERSEDDIEAVEVWTCMQPVARSYSAGPYHSEWFEAGGRKVGVYLLGNKPMSAGAQAEILASALDAMEARFGPYPYSTYIIAEVPSNQGSFGASSEQGFILCKPRYFQVEGGNLPLFAHEAAHGWWGNLVGQRGPGSILCSESLAQYGAVLAIEGLESPEAATEFLRFSRAGYVDVQCARGYFELARRGHDKPLSELSGGGWQHNLADAKGHWFFHMVRGRLGDERFFDALRELIDTYTGQAMSLADVREVFVAADDDPDGMQRFLAQWLDRAGAPILEAELTRDSTKPELVLHQAHSGEPYELALEVDLVGHDGRIETRTLEIAERTTRIVLDSGKNWTEARIDPRHRLLVWTPEYGDKPAD